MGGYTTLGFCGTPHLIRNINTTVVPAGSFPQYLGVLSGKVLFGATDGTGAGLWVTDGTTAGTVLIYRVQVLAQLSFPGTPNYAVLGNRGYFVGSDAVNGAQLWSTDRTASGTSMVVNLGPSGTTASPVIYGLFGSLVIFSKVGASGVQQLYATDGTSANTVALTSLSGQYSYVASEFLVVGSKFYFATGGVNTVGNAAGQIWVSDGTIAGTRPVTTPSSIADSALYHPHAFTLLGPSFLYLSSGFLWSVDTSTDTIGTVTATGGVPGFGPPSVNEAGGLIAMNGFVLFLGNNLPGDQELWRSDGTSAGTSMVTVINPAPNFNSSQYPLLKKVGNRVLFIGSDAQYGLQLWSSDGTSANTARLTNATEPANSSFQIAIFHATLAGTAYVSISDGASSTTWSVWRTDGTAAGTRRVSGLPPIDQSEPGNTQVIGDGTTVYVEIQNTSGTTSLYKYQPTADAATLLSSALSTSLTDGYLDVAGMLYLSSNDPVVGDEPWISNGTVAGTHLLLDIDPETMDNSSSPDEFVNFNGVLAFVADDGVHGQELWKSDGTAGGTGLPSRT